MRVAQIIDSLYVGGAERMQLTYAQAAMARGEIPTVIVLARFPSPIPDQLRAMGVRVVEITGRSLIDRARFARLVAFLRAEQFDVIHAHLGYAIILGVAAGFVTHTPLVASLHNVKPDRHVMLESIALYFGARRIIAVGAAVAQAYQKRLPGRKIETILNPVRMMKQISESERNSVRSELLGDGRPRHLLIGVGRLEEQKGWFDLLEAMNILRQTHPDAMLLIVGQGTLQDDLQRRIDELEMKAHVRLLGPRDDVSRLLAASDVFVMTSHWEGMPISVLEAMAAGLPVIATRVGDIPNIVTSQTGMLVDARQPAQFARAIQEILDDPVRGRDMGEAGRLLVSERHSPERWLDSLRRLYSSV